MTTRLDELPVVVIGAGPVGLAAAAHLAERGIAFTVLEAGDAPGHGGAAVGTRAAVLAVAVQRRRSRPPAARRGRLGRARARTCCRPATSSPTTTCSRSPTSPRSSLTSATAPASWPSPGSGSTGSAPPVARTPRFWSASPSGDDILARAVIDASGTWGTPNVLGASGIPARRRRRRGPVRRRTPCPTCWARTATASPASEPSSSAPAIRRPTRCSRSPSSPAQAPGTSVVWAIRATSAARTYGGEAADALPARGALGTPTARARRGRHHRAGHRVRGAGRSDPHRTGGWSCPTAPGTLTADRIVSATGFRPDHRIAAELRLDLDPILGSTRALAPLIDPNQHSCGTVPPHGVDELDPPRARLLRDRREELRPRTHLPARHRLRAGPLGRRRAGRRLDGGPRRAARPARDRRLQQQPRRGQRHDRRQRWMLRYRAPRRRRAGVWRPVSCSRLRSGSFR